MPKFGILIGGRVTNVIICDSLNDAQIIARGNLAIEIPEDANIGIGWDWNGTEFYNSYEVEPVVE
jgi:hypothetical protein